MFVWVPCDASLLRTAVFVSSNPSKRSVMLNREHVREIETGFTIFLCTCHSSASRLQHKESNVIQTSKHVLSYKITILHLAPDESSVLEIFFEFRLLHKLGFVLNYI